MQISDNESNSSEGFIAHQISVLKDKQQQTPILNDEENQDFNFSEANQLISYQRPTDLLPRIIVSAGQYEYKYVYGRCYRSQLDKRGIQQIEEQLIPITPQKNKERRFPSLKDKYHKNQQYECIYSKLHQNSEFDEYIFSLQNTTDYNPDDYKSPLDKCNQTTSKFNSRFQSGNLLYAYKVKTSKLQQYDLIMQNDTNTNGYNQWFYFSYQNHKSKKVRFNIVNFIKKRLMFLDGVKPVGLSMMSWQAGWKSIGSNISYRKSFITRTINSLTPGNPPSYKNYYTLSFDVEFRNQNDKYYIALNYPYTYSNMVSFLQRTISNASSEIQIQKSIICHTISNNPILCLRIKHKQYSQKGKIVCLARQHPGQTVGSFVIESFIQEMLKHQIILKNYEIIAIPMVNPDGVIYGNFRTNLSGFDLNRQWISPNRWLHPQIFFIKKFISSLTNIAFCIDFHGHSKKLNSFIYACLDECIADFRVYPYMMGNQCQTFSVKDCTYTLTPDKFRTARINIFNEIKKPYVYTVETSFFGYTKNKKSYRFNHRHFVQVGQAAVNCIQTLLFNKQLMKNMIQEVNDKAYLFDLWNAQNKDNIDSQSNPSQDQLTVVERKNKVMSDMALRRKIKSKKKKKNKTKLSEQLKLSKKSSKKLSQKIILKKRDKTIQQLKLEEELQIQKFKKAQPTKNIREKAHSNVIILSKPKIAKPQFIQKPKPAQSFSQIKESIKNQLHLISKNRRPIKKIEVQQQQVQDRQSHSNLLQGSGYMKLREQKVRLMKQQKKLNEAQYYLSMMAPSSIKCSNKSLLGQSLEEGRKKEKGKLREKIYVIKQHKVINSITRINDDQIKEQLERQIQSRTTTLKNCQKIMNSLTNPLEKERMIAQKSKIDDPQVAIEAFKNRTFLKPIEGKKKLEARHSERIEKGGIFFYNL